MNHLLTIQCAECERKINLRVGMSNREFQPLRITCRGCGSTLELDFRLRTKQGLDNLALAQILKGNLQFNFFDHVEMTLRGAVQVQTEPFENDMDFADLHLDFPVSFEPYVMGETPYLRATRQFGVESVQRHSRRLDILNEQYKNYKKVSKLIGMFLKGHYGPFRELARKTFKVPPASKKLEDLNSALYTILDAHVLPFTFPANSAAIVNQYSSLLVDLIENKRDATLAFLDRLVESSFLDNSQRDCLRIYEPVFLAEMPLRPAMLLDFDPTYVEGQIPMRVSTNEFEGYREVYKDMAELLSRLLVLVAGINNLIHRGDHNSFLKGAYLAPNGKDFAPKDLDAFANLPLARKPDFLDDCWFTVDPIAHDNRLRNAIAHNKIEYDEVAQTITYYPKMEGMEREAKSEIQLIDYMRRMLALFREIHRLHHLMKCLNYAILLKVHAR
ncbi:hypothetical protein AUC70_13370 [Methyloceanibacter stevinii]|uniref:Uncharacterized protein n=1 Tax=Methyloceanibacter stevinii TaxID=1774970 RepID=A0A1E3VWA5_9HYPH|nr:hypothetical protein [Methyloceanibacter stevinii]ODR97236.1 hypothetical protein AUC70_13370 [Methyloceanibacter stevinii]